MHKTPKIKNPLGFLITEREGFEPSEPGGSTVFETARFDRSRISPVDRTIQHRGFLCKGFESLRILVFKYVFYTAYHVDGNGI